MTTTADAPQVAELVRVRRQQGVVSRNWPSEQPRDELALGLPGRTLVALNSVSDDDLRADLAVAWDVEPGREVLPETRLPQVTATGWDHPQASEAFLAATRRGTAGSTANRTLQARRVVPR